MSIKRGNVALLDDPVATELLQSGIPARLAYISIDGLPRVVPVWCGWNGRGIVVVSPSTSAKLKSLARNPNVALTIDSTAFPYHVLLVRGTATMEMVDGLAPEFCDFACRYMGAEAGRAFCEMYAGVVSRMPEPRSARITVTPNWVSINDFETRFPPQIAPYLVG
jgi:PPOX class probable F420-dependent enzyme